MPKIGRGKRRSVKTEYEKEQNIIGYSRLSPLIDDKTVSDIRVVGYDNVRVKRMGRRMATDICFSSLNEYRRFIDYIISKNRVNISDLRAIHQFTDKESHPEFILRFTLSVSHVNNFNEPYLCIRKVPKSFPRIKELIEQEMMDSKTAQLLIDRFRAGSTLICGGNASGKTTLLNALKETLPDDMAVLVIQQTDELTTTFHPDMMFLHYDPEHFGFADLAMDVDFFIIGEVGGAEAPYLLNTAYTGQICAATIPAPSADRAPDKLVDYCLRGSKYSRDALMPMMGCFHTFIFMEHYRVKEILACRGWSSKHRNLIYERIL